MIFVGTVLKIHHVPKLHAHKSYTFPVVVMKYPGKTLKEERIYFDSEGGPTHCNGEVTDSDA